MRRVYIAMLALIFVSTTATAQNKEEKDLPTIISEMLESLEKSLKLEDWQLFRMDSTLMFNYTALNDEIAELRRAGVYNNEIYMRTTDKWTSAVDTTFEKEILTPEQWKKYLKSDYGREKRARDKRMALRAAKEAASAQPLE